MKPKKKFFAWLSVALLLSLATGVAISAVTGIDLESGSYNIAKGLQWFFDGWHGSKTMSIVAVLCVVLAIAGRGIERR